MTPSCTSHTQPTCAVAGIEPEDHVSRHQAAAVRQLEPNRRAASAGIKQLLCVSWNLILTDLGWHSHMCGQVRHP